MYHSCQRVSSPLILWATPYTLYPLFSLFVQPAPLPPPPPPPPSFGTLVPRYLWYLAACFMQQGFSLLRSNAWRGCLLVLIWYLSRTHTQQTHKTHTQEPIDRLTRSHKYILTPSVMCSWQLSVLPWMNNLLLSKLYITEFFNVFAFQKSLTYRNHISVD